MLALSRLVLEQCMAIDFHHLFAMLACGKTSGLRELALAVPSKRMLELSSLSALTALTALTVAPGKGSVDFDGFVRRHRAQKPEPGG